MSGSLQGDAFYSNKMLEIGKVAIVVPNEYPFAGTLRDLKKLFPGVEPIKAGEWKDDEAVKPTCWSLRGQTGEDLSMSSLLKRSTTL